MKKNQSVSITLIFIIIVLVAIGGYILLTLHKAKKDITMNDLKIEILKEGQGVPAQIGDSVTVNYTGTLEDGFEFDSSLRPGRTPFTVVLGEGRVIQGWEKGLLGIKVGEKRHLVIPPAMGYGPREIPGLIPANSVLVFDVEALDITQAHK